MKVISLLHATYLSDANPLDHRDHWLDRADFPSRIEYVVAMNEEDHRAVASTQGATRIVSRPQDKYSTAVQNWNAAARAAQGELLFVISDDLHPPQGWDTAIEALVERHDPLVEDFAIKIQDSPSDLDTLLRHPIISRAFYESFGLFDPDFRGVFCDNDITMRAYLSSRILDGRSIRFGHLHPHSDQNIPESKSHAKINTPEECVLGNEIFRRKFSPITVSIKVNRLSLPSPNRLQQLQIGASKLTLAVLNPLTKMRGLQASRAFASIFHYGTVRGGVH